MESTPLALNLVGPKGATTVPLKPFIVLKHDEQNRLCVSVDDADKKVQRSMWGTTRTLIANAIQGLTEGFALPLRLVGVGYRAAVEPDPNSKSGKGVRLHMRLGFAHPVFIPVPDEIEVSTPMPTRILLKGTDKHKLGQFAAEIRQWRKPEPYKGKVSLHEFQIFDMLLI